MHKITTNDIIAAIDDENCRDAERRTGESRQAWRHRVRSLWKDAHSRPAKGTANYNNAPLQRADYEHRMARLRAGMPGLRF